MFHVFFFAVPEFILMCGSRYRINCLGSRKIEFQSLFCHTPSLKTKNLYETEKSKSSYKSSTII